MDQAAPPSPAPSSDDINKANLHRGMLRDATASYSGSRPSADAAGMDRSSSRARFTTLSPKPEPYYEFHSPYHHHQHHHAHDDISMYHPTETAYIHAGEINRQPYRTPDTSPPTPYRGSDALTTRSGLRVNKASANTKPPVVKGARVEKPAPKKKRERSKTTKKLLSGVPKPLSELAKEKPEVPVADIGAYVHRSVQERHREVEQSKQPGKIKRPMNAFMLYRKAYQNLAKEFCTQNNHQLVSQVCGSSWPSEPEKIREQFNEWAKAERVNHQQAHPGYKFTPSKPRPKGRDEADLQSVEGGSLGDLEWDAGHTGSKGMRHQSRPGHGKQEAPPSIFQSFAGGAGPAAPALQSTQPMFSYGSPGKVHPASYGQPEPVSGQYYNQKIYQQHDTSGLAEDMMGRRQMSPGPAFGAPGNEGFHAMGPYGHMPHERGLGSTLDAGILGVEGDPYGVGSYANPLLEGQPKWANPLDDPRQDVSLYEDVYLDPQLQLLRGQESSWRVEELDSDHFNNWMDPQG